jgi:ABC-type Fe3+ transport system permease subunit
VPATPPSSAAPLSPIDAGLLAAVLVSLTALMLILLYYYSKGERRGQAHQEPAAPPR